jgi:hypothetical protein
MFNKLSTKVLVTVFGLLLIAVFYLFLFDGNKNERTFRNELVFVDTSKVDEIYLYPKAENYNEVYLKKINDNWKVKIGEDKFAEVPNSKIKNLFAQLLTIKPKRLASRDEAKWKDYQVDSTGTRVKIFEDGEQTLDIILGRFSFQQPRSMSTFVRLAEDTDVYEVDGFLDMTFNQSANSFRNNTIVSDNKNNWQSLTFIYPADSSFRMEKKDDKWFVDNIETDSAKTEQFLNKLSRLSHQLSTPTYSLKIDNSDTTSITVNGFEMNGKLLITSSQNKESIFESDNNLKQNIFISSEKVLK